MSEMVTSGNVFTKLVEFIMLMIRANYRKKIRGAKQWNHMKKIEYVVDRVQCLYSKPMVAQGRYHCHPVTNICYWIAL